MQSIYYGIIFKAGDPKPRPQSPRFQADRRRIYILIVSLYLLYTIYEADYELRRQSSYYADLGLPFDASERDIKSRFRRVAAMHHPDKAGPGGADDGTYFIHLKTASDTLQDAAKRFAYERFGPDVVNWQRCTTIKDYVMRGIVSGIIPQYVVTAATVGVLSFFGYLDVGKYYRWLLIVGLWVFELHAVTRPTLPGFLNVINAFLVRATRHEPFLPFQAIALARKLSITIYMAMSQLGPILVSDMQENQKRPVPDDEKSLQQGLARLEEITKMLDSDAARLMEMELAPFRGDSEATTSLQSKMSEWLVQNTVRADPMVRDALGQSFRRRRVDAPAGAKGNRTS